MSCLQHTVTVAKSPSGTLATNIPIRNIQASSQSYPNIRPMIKNDTPNTTATAVINLIKCSISIAIGVSKI